MPAPNGRYVAERGMQGLGESRTPRRDHTPLDVTDLQKFSAEARLAKILRRDWCFLEHFFQARAYDFRLNPLEAFAPQRFF